MLELNTIISIAVRTLVKCRVYVAFVENTQGKDYVVKNVSEN